MTIREMIDACESTEAARELGYHAMYGPVDVEVKLTPAPTPRPRNKASAFLRGMYEGRRDWPKDLEWHDGFARNNRVIHDRDLERYMRVANVKATQPISGDWNSAEEVCRELRALGVRGLAVVATPPETWGDNHAGRAGASVPGGSEESSAT